MDNESTEPYTLRWTWAIRDNEELSPGARLLGLLLAAFCDSANECYPGREKLALLMGVSLSSIRRYLRELKDRDFIEITVNRGRNRTNRYLLTFPENGSPQGSENGSGMTTENGSRMNHKERHEERHIEVRQEEGYETDEMDLADLMDDEIYLRYVVKD